MKEMDSFVPSGAQRGKAKRVADGPGIPGRGDNFITASLVGFSLFLSSSAYFFVLYFLRTLLLGGTENEKTDCFDIAYLHDDASAGLR